MGVWWSENEGTCLDTTSMMIIAAKTPTNAHAMGIRLPVGAGLVVR